MVISALRAREWWVSVVIFCHLFLVGHVGESSVVYQEGRLLMGTVVTLTIPSDDEELARSAAEQAFGAMEAVDQCMSLYREESELSRLNRSPARHAIPVTQALFTVIEAAIKYAELTSGAFDITVAPAVRAWGFMSGEWRVPTPEELERLRSIVGYRLIRLDRARRSVELACEGVEIDLGGIAKGYAIDAAREALEEAGLRDGMIDAGGDIYVMGGQPGQETWNVGIRHPVDESRLLTVLRVTNRAVATSGNAARSFVRDGTLYGHILDPRTLLPTRGTLSVTVIAPSAMMADALATATFVLGPEEGMKFINQLPEVEAIICADGEATGADVCVFVSDGLEGKVEFLGTPECCNSQEVREGKL